MNSKTAHSWIQKMACFSVIMLIALFLSYTPAYADGDQSAVVPEPEGITPRDTIDSPLELYINKETNYGSQIRYKSGASSVYANIWQAPNICNLYTDGLKSDAGTGRTNCTVNGVAVLTKTGKYEILNMVNEWGFQFTQITALRTGAAFAVIGSWSPDYAYEPGVLILNP